MTAAAEASANVQSFARRVSRGNDGGSRMTGSRPRDDISYDAIVAARASSRSKRMDIPCPVCAPLREGAAARRRVMRTWAFADGRFGVCCVRCGAEGWVAPDGPRSAPPKTVQAERPASDDNDERERQRKA